jgi:hypothetical protein
MTGVVVAGFWGAFFCAVALMLAGSLAAFFRSLQRVALTAALSSLLSALFVVAYLGWLPVGDAGAQARLLAHLAILCSAALGLMLLAMLGLLRQPRRAQRIRFVLAALTVAILLAGWALQPMAALALSSLVAIVGGALALAACLRSALRGDRLAWLAVCGVAFMLVALSGLSWIALDREHVGWPVQVLSAVAGTAYLASMALALWARYSYLIELREVMAHGPSYDPVTRMRSHAETGQLVGDVFKQTSAEMRPVGVIVISIANLYALEQLHGRGAVNHALFICAGRLRRSCCCPAVRAIRRGWWRSRDRSPIGSFARYCSIHPRSRPSRKRVAPRGRPRSASVCSPPRRRRCGPPSPSAWRATCPAPPGASPAASPGSIATTARSLSCR